jgi:hypothetical protein
MLNVTIYDNPLDNSIRHEFTNVESIHTVLKRHYASKLPKNVRIYHNTVDQQHDVTPHDEDGIERLGQLQGHIHVINYPEEPTTLLIGAALFVGGLVVRAIVDYFDKPKPKQLVTRGSPNNALGERANQARPLGRIPDIFGSVKAVPDLIQHPYTVYENNTEVEVALMCIGRGYYEVNSFTVREGDTRVEEIPGMSVSVYDPLEIPGVGTPSLVLGDPITDPVYNVYPVKGVNGQLLPAYNEHAILGSIKSEKNVWGFGMSFAYPSPGLGEISIRCIDSPTEVTDLISVGDILDLRFDIHGISEFTQGPSLSAGGFGLAGAPTLADLGHGYEVTAIDDSDISPPGFDSWAATVVLTVDVPAALQAEWDKIATFSASFGALQQGRVVNHAAIIIPEEGWEGPFFGDDPNMQKIYCNFVADNGLYMNDSHNQKAINVDIDVEVAPANVNGTIAGAWEAFSTTLNGAALSRTTKGTTFVIEPSFTGRFLIRARRATTKYWRTYQHAQEYLINVYEPLDVVGGAYSGRPDVDLGQWAPHFGDINEDIRWSHCYSMSVPDATSFGVVTLVHARTINNRRVSEIRDRKLNMVVIRKQRTWNGTTFGGSPTATEFPEDVFFEICKDTRLGRLADTEIDFAGIAAAFQSVRDYFGYNLIDFGYTFDADDISLEEMLTVVAENSFCTVYREGAVLKVKPNIATDDSVLLFNHRNKIPGSEERQVNFGNEQEYDGVQIDYTDGTTGEIKTIFIPDQSETLRPRQIDLVGINSKERAITLAWRVFNKLRYQHTTVDFKALPEAALAVVDDRILVSDNTRSVVQDGEIIAVSGLTVTCSQDVELDPGGTYTLFLQNIDGTVEGIAVTQGASDRELVLGTAPSFTIITDPADGLRTLYMLVADDEVLPRAFLLAEKSADTNGNFRLSAYNYSHGYYFNDGLNIWIPFVTGIGDIPTIYDWGPHTRTVEVIGGGLGTGISSGRSTVYSSSASATGLTITAGDGPSITSYTTYTKAGWIYRDATGVAGDILFGTPSPSIEEVVLISSSDELRVFHGGVQYVSHPGIPATTWTHVAVTWSAITLEMKLYVNGTLVDSATGVPAPGVKTGLVAMENFEGDADDLRLYRRVLSAGEVKELYQKTLNTFSPFD